jgi:hypothetical protein
MTFFAGTFVFTAMAADLYAATSVAAFLYRELETKGQRTKE